MQRGITKNRCLSSTCIMPFRNTSTASLQQAGNVSAASCMVLLMETVWENSISRNRRYSTQT